MSFWSWSLPQPQGKFTTIGTKNLFWTSKDNHHTVGVLVKLWFPLGPSNTKRTRAPYMNDLLITKMHELNMSHMPKWLVKYIFSNMITNAFAATNTDTLPSDLKQLPVVVFSHGLFGNPEVYSAYCENLASFGYLVVAPYHTDSSCLHVTYPIVHELTKEPISIAFEHLSNDAKQDKTKEHKFRNSQLIKRVADIQFILDHLFQLNTQKISEHDAFLEQRIDTSRIGITGHSFGGCTAIASCHADSRLSCCIALDSWLFPLPHELDKKPTTTPEAPLFIINSDKWQWEENLKKQTQVLNDMNTGEVYKYTIPESLHQNFSDIAIIAPRMSKWMGVCGGDPVAIVKETNSLMVAFFNMQMKLTTDTVQSKLTTYKYTKIVKALTTDEQKQPQLEQPEQKQSVQ